MSQENTLETGMSSAETMQSIADMENELRERRRDLVAQAARERLQGVATQSRSVAGAARTRVSPYAETAQERIRRSREQFRQRGEQPLVQEQPQPQPQQMQQSSIPVVPLIIAAIVAVVALLAFLRSRTSEEAELDDMDLLLDVGVSLSEMGEPSLMYADDDLIVAVEER